MRRLAPFIALILLGLALFAPLALRPMATLYSDHSDLLALHLPSKKFLVRSWRETGALPLWCPYAFAGMPFVHDVQAAAFYPFTLPLYFLSEQALGPAMSWILVAHVVAAGCCMYGYARHQGLSELGAFVAGMGYMLVGKWMLHLLAAGHYNMIPLAWLPLMLLCLERAAAGRSMLWAAWAGAVFSLFILCAYPYLTLYAGAFAAVWTLAPALQRAGFLESDKHEVGLARALARWFIAGSCTVLVACLLGAVQLLPALEASTQSSRAMGVGADSAFLANSLRAVFRLIGPGLTSADHWEQRGNFGLIWVVAAALAPLLRTGRTRFQALVCLGLIIYALGGAAVLQRLPGFNLFRLPVRALLLAGLPLSLLAGVTTESLFLHGEPSPELRRAARKLAILVTVILLVLTASYAEALRGDGTSLRFDLYWLCLPVMAGMAFWLVGLLMLATWQRWLWTAILLVDAWLLAWPLVAVRSDAIIYAPSPIVRALLQSERDHQRVLDRPPGGLQASGPLWPGLAVVLGQEAIEGFNPIDVARFKKYLQFISGEDKPLVSLRDVWTLPTLPNFPVHNKQLLDLLGVAFIMQPAEWGPQTGGAGDPPGNPSWTPIAQDPQPEAYDLGSGGMRLLPPYALYQDKDAFPRVFVVHRAVPLPANAMPALLSTDLRQTVLLEDWNQTITPTGAATGSATIRQYLPNSISIQVTASAPGFLVLADVWFPGWVFRIDGQPAPLYRADYLFRAAAVPAGAHEVVFSFEPASYRIGKLTSLAGLALLAITTLFILALHGLGHRSDLPSLLQSGQDNVKS
jgi:hypothetical protein